MIYFITARAVGLVKIGMPEIRKRASFRSRLTVLSASRWSA